MATVKRLDLLPRGLLIAFAVGAIVFGFMLAISPVQALRLTPSCTPPTVDAGNIVTCDLSVGLADGEILPIASYDITVTRGGVTVVQMQFNLKGEVIAIPVSPAGGVSVSSKPTINPAFGYGYGQINTGAGDRTVSFGGSTLNFGAGFGYGYINTGGQQQNLFLDLDYSIRIDTTGFQEGVHTVQFVLNTGASPATISATQVSFTINAPEEETTPTVDPGEVDELLVLSLLDTVNIIDTFFGGLNQNDVANIANALDGASTATAVTVVEKLSNDNVGKIVTELSTEKAVQVFKAISTDETKRIVENMADTDKGAKKAADVLSDLTKDTAGTTKAIAVIKQLAGDAAGTAKAAKVMDQIEKVAAGTILTNLPDNERQEVVLQMKPETLKNTLPEVSPEALRKIDPKKLMEHLPTVPPDQLAGDKTPKVEAGTPVGKVIQSFGNVAIYEIKGTGEFIWVKIVGSPDPIERVIAQFTEDISSVSIIVNPVGIKKPATAPALPDGLVAHQYFYFTLSVEPEKIKQGLIAFYVTKSWLAENSFHKWSVVLQRLDSEAGAWQAVQTQVTREDDIYVYYDAPVPGFSLFAITGAAEPVVLEYTVADLLITPAVAEDGATVTITAAVTNTGTESQSIPLNMSVNGQVDDSQSVSVAAGATETVTFTTVQSLGSYEVRVDRLYGNFTVEAQQVATPTPEPTVVPPQPTATSAPPAPTATSGPAPAATATRAPAPAATATSAPAATATSAPAPAATATSAPAPAPTAVATIEPADDDDGNNGLIIGIIIVVVLIGGGIAFFAIRSRRKV